MATAVAPLRERAASESRPYTKTSFIARKPRYEGLSASRHVQSTGLKTGPYTNTKMPGSPVRTGTQNPRKPGATLKSKKPESGEPANALCCVKEKPTKPRSNVCRAPTQIDVVDRSG